MFLKKKKIKRTERYGFIVLRLTTSKYSLNILQIKKVLNN